MDTLRVFPLSIFLSSLLACSSPAAENALVDGERVLRHVSRIVEHGPHPPGSTAQEKVASYIESQLKELGIKVHSHDFRAVTPRGRLPMRNIWGFIPGKRHEVLVLGSHYDSKYFERISFVGANDGGSSSGLLLELASLLVRHNPTDYSLWLVFFDGEEALEEWTNLDSLYGSREFVRMLKRRGQLSLVSAVILLDLVGASDLRLHRELYSTPWLADLIWSQAQQLGHDSLFRYGQKIAVEDDHVPFLQEGIPAANLIGFNYPHWHTREDTLDKLSARNLEIIGNVVLSSLPVVAGYLKRQSKP